MKPEEIQVGKSEEITHKVQARANLNPICGALDGQIRRMWTNVNCPECLKLRASKPIPDIARLEWCMKNLYRYERAIEGAPEEIHYFESRDKIDEEIRKEKHI